MNNNVLRQKFVKMPGKVFAVSVCIILGTLYLGNQYKAYIGAAFISVVAYLVFQLLALLNCKKRQRLFSYLDYIYYLFIGIVVSVGSQLIERQADFADYYASLEVEILDVEISGLSRELEQIRKQVSSANYNQFISGSGCSVTDNQKLKDVINLDSNVYTNTDCYEYDEVKSGYLLKKHNLDSKNKEKEKLDLSARKSFQKESSINPVEQLESIKRKNDLMYYWLPLILIIGVTIKLGKTTSSIAPAQRD